MGFLQDLIPGFSDIGWAPSFLKGQRTKSINELCDLILTSDGEYSSLMLADQVLSRFELMTADEKIEFFNYLNNDLDIDKTMLQEAALNFCKTSSAIDLETLNVAARAPRRLLLQVLNQVPEGTQRLVKMRSEVLSQLKKHPDLLKLSNELLSLFSNWFNRGFLELRQVDWTTSAHILEKIIEYEAVHEIGNWRELRARLEPEDRFCFAFFHPSMSEEPLVFVEVALTSDVPNQLEQLLAEERDELDPNAASCAVFYSISNCHRGLAGVSFGNFLIKQVATALQHDFPALKTFATLSPAPLFSRWLEKETTTETESLTDKNLETLAAQYYLSAKDKEGFPFDPVARFHLRNGANLHRINMGADQSEKGIRNSKGMMVNYVYDLTKVAENHEVYSSQKKVVHHSQIAKLAASAPGA